MNYLFVSTHGIRHGNEKGDSGEEDRREKNTAILIGDNFLSVRLVIE